MWNKEIVERASGLAKEVEDRRRAKESKEWDEKKKAESARREREAAIQIQKDRIESWFAGEDAQKIGQILRSLKSRIPLGRIRLTTYREESYGRDSLFGESTAHVDYKEESLEVFLCPRDSSFHLGVEVDLPDERDLEENLLSEWCRKVRGNPLERLTEIIMAWIKKI